MQDADVEVVVRNVGDCWVAGRAAGRRRLVVVLEGRGEGGLLMGFAVGDALGLYYNINNMYKYIINNIYK